MLLLLSPLVRAVEFTIQSPEKGEVWPKSSMTDQVLRWNEKQKVLVAEVTFSTGNYAGMGEAAEKETYEFTFPGVMYDPDQRLFFAPAPNGEKVPVAQRTKVWIGSRIDLCKVATIHVSRFKTELTLYMVVNTQPSVEVPIKDGEDGVKSVPLDQMISH
jgi:hypothetical protein